MNIAPSHASIGWGLAVLVLGTTATTSHSSDVDNATRVAREAAADTVVTVARRALRRPGEHAGLAQTCLALASAQEQGPTDAYQKELVHIVSALVEEKDLNKDGRVGWGIPREREKTARCPQEGMLDPFSDGTCNPVHTEYMFQTALATMCLARAYEISGEASFRQVAKQAIDDSWNVGAAPKECPQCFYYWYSYSRSDFDRYVRNTNALMGAAVAWVWKITGDPKYKARAEQVARAEAREVKAGNMGYFGMDDPRFRSNPQREAKRIENHSPWVAKGALEIGRILKDPSIIENGLKVQHAWQSCREGWTCNKGCATLAADPTVCKESATFSPCFFRGEKEEYSKACFYALEKARVRGQTPYMLWSILDR